MLATRRLPSSGTDAYGDDGVLYRFVTGHGWEFHPLGDFGALNTLILTGKTDQAKELADALVARGIPKDGRLLWSYPFPFGSGKPPWRSGMAQAVAAQALARVRARARRPDAARRGRRGLRGRSRVGWFGRFRRAPGSSSTASTLRRC